LEREVSALYAHELASINQELQRTAGAKG